MKYKARGLFGVFLAVALALGLFAAVPAAYAYDYNELPNFKVVSPGVVSWDHVPDADSYSLSDLYAGGIRIAKTPSGAVDQACITWTDKGVTFNLGKYMNLKGDCKSGTYNVTFQAIRNNTTMNYKSSYQYQYTAPQTKLDKPQNLAWREMTAKWDTVKNATAYIVDLYDVTSGSQKSLKNVIVTDNKYVFAKSLFTYPEHEYIFTVSAIADNYVTSDRSGSKRKTGDAFLNPVVVQVSSVNFEKFTLPVNGGTYTTDIKTEFGFPGRVTRYVFSMFQKSLNGTEAYAGDKIGFCVYVDLDDGYEWAADKTAYLNGQKQETIIHNDGMGTEYGFLWNFTIGFTDKIQITDQSPVIYEYVAGNDIKLYVKATGADSYQWQRYEMTGSGGAKQKYGPVNISGATSREYTISKADSSYDGKEYRCVLTSSDGTVYSKVIQLKLVSDTFSVTLEHDGNGTVSASPVSGKNGTVVTISATPNPGYKFKEWVRMSGMLSGGLEVPNATSATTSFTISGYNVKLRAKFEKEPGEYTVTFDAGEGTVSPGSAKTGTDGKLGSLPTPVKEGYIFTGWYTAATGGVNVDTSKEYTSDTTLYAHWREGTGPIALLKVIKLNIDSKIADVNDIKVTMDAAPYLTTIKGMGYTMVPIRFVSEQLGAKVDFTSAAKPIVITLGGKTVTLTLGKAEPAKGLDVAPAAKAGRTYVPLRYVSEQVGAYVDYNSKTKLITITQK